jgi:transcriptional regulator with XRE-family HTH domain
MPRKSTTLDVGRQVVAARLRRGLTQRAVCARAGLAPSYLSRVEHGVVQPTLPTVLRIAQALREPLAALLSPWPGGAGDAREPRPCPVSPTGQCLLDLLDVTADRGASRPRTAKGGRRRFNTRQLHLLHQFAAILDSGDTDLLAAYETLISRSMKGIGRG